MRAQILLTQSAFIFTINGMNYEWDEQKRHINIKKHGIDFIDVPQIFDGDTLFIPDERFEYGEIRFLSWAC